MRRRNEIFSPEQHVRLGGLLDEHVKGRAADMAAIETGAKGDLIHQPAPGAVDDQHPFLGLGQVLSRQDVAGLVGERGMQGNDIGAGQQVVQLNLLDAQFDGAFRREEGVVSHNLHLQAIGAVSNDAADIARPDEAEGLGVEFYAHEPVLLPFAGLGGRVGGRELASQRKHHGDSVLGGGDRVTEGGIHHHDAPRRRRRDIDIVNADPGAADYLEVHTSGENVLVGLGGGANGQAVIVADDFE